MTERPAELRALTERRLAVAGFADVPLHHVAPGEHPAFGERRIARSIHPAITVEDDLGIAEFLATYASETILVDDRYNRGPVRSFDLMRIARADLANVLDFRLAAGPGEPTDVTDPQPALARV